MPVPMTLLWKHPKTGVYWPRKRVTDDLREHVGKREETLSLKTKDAAEAKRFLLQALSELEMRWANLREGHRSLSEREAHESRKLFMTGGLRPIGTIQAIRSIGRLSPSH